MLIGTLNHSQTIVRTPTVRPQHNQTIVRHPNPRPQHSQTIFRSPYIWPQHNQTVVRQTASGLNSIHHNQTMMGRPGLAFNITRL